MIPLIVRTELKSKNCIVHHRMTQIYMRACHDGKGEIQLSASQCACSDVKTKGEISGKCRECISVNYHGYGYQGFQ